MQSKSGGLFSRLLHGLQRYAFFIFIPIAVVLLLLIMFGINIDFKPHFTQQDSWSYFDAFITVFTFMGVMWSIQSNKRQRDSQMQHIGVFLKFRNGKRAKLKSYTIRKNFSRGDLKGILRDICVGNYEVKYFASEAFLADVDAVQQGNKHDIEINVDADGITLVNSDQQQKSVTGQQDRIPVHADNFKDFFCTDSTNQAIPVIEDAQASPETEPQTQEPTDTDQNQSQPAP